MLPLAHEQEFTNSIKRSKTLHVVPNGATITIQTRKGHAGDWVDTSNTFTAAQVFQLASDSSLVMRLKMSDGGASAEAYLSQ